MDFVKAATSIAVAVIVGGTASSATAGTFNVVACKDAPSGANASWTPLVDPTGGLEVGANCANDGNYGGLWVRDRLRSATNVASSATAGWVFDAPDGTTITKVTARRWLYKDGDDDWSPRFGGADVFETCAISYPATTCAVGGVSTSESVPPDRLVLAAKCEDNPSANCVPGGTLHQVSAVLYGATVTLSDSSPALVSTLAGSAFSGDYSRGVRDVRFDASDNVGIRSSRLFVDGSPGGGTTYSCDFTYAVPCSNRTDASLALDTRTLSDGEHVVRVGASDPAGNEGLSSARTIVVDNGAPAAPLSLAADGGAELTTPDFRVRWANPAGQVSPVVAARWRLCGSDGLSCESGRQAAPDISELSTLTLPDRGEWRLSVWLEDAAGNVDPSRASSLSLRYGIVDSTPPAEGDTAEPSPVALPGTMDAPASTDASPLTSAVSQTTLPITSTTPRLPARLAIRSIKRRGRSVVVRGAAAVGASGPLRLTLRSGRRVVTVERRLRAGAFTLRLRAPRAGRVTARFLGSAGFLPGRASKTFR